MANPLAPSIASLNAMFRSRGQNNQADAYYRAQLQRALEQQRHQNALAQQRQRHNLGLAEAANERAAEEALAARLAGLSDQVYGKFEMPGDGVGPPHATGILADPTLSNIQRAALQSQRAMLASGHPALQEAALENWDKTYGSLVPQATAQGQNLTAAQKNFRELQELQDRVNTIQNDPTLSPEARQNALVRAESDVQEFLDFNRLYAPSRVRDLAAAKKEGEIQAQTIQERLFSLPNAIVAADAQISDIDYTIKDLNRLLGLTDYTTVGLGSLIADVPLTGAADWAALRNSILSNIGLEKLKQMKQESQTGASGLGALSEKELQLLQDDLASLEQAQSPPQIRTAISRIIERLTNQRQRLIDSRKWDIQWYDSNKQHLPRNSMFDFSRIAAPQPFATSTSPVSEPVGPPAVRPGARVFDPATGTFSRPGEQ